MGASAYKIAERKNDIAKFADKNGYSFVDYQENIGLLSYQKEGVRINVYLTTLTVGTCMNHPKKGKTQLYRKKLSINEVKHIFLNPRVHTGLGYYEKKK